MKKVFWMILIFMFILMPVDFGIAAEETEEPKDYIQSLIFELSNKKVLKQDDKHAIISFDIHNPTGDYYPEVFYTPSLMVFFNQAELSELKRYIEYDPVGFEIGPNETKTLIYDLKFPEALPKMEFAAGLCFSVKSHTLSVNDEIIYLNDIDGKYSGFLISDDDYLKVDGEEYDSGRGPNIKIESQPEGIINLTSLFSSEKIVLPQFSVYKRSTSTSTTPLSVTFGKSITFKPGETKTVSLKLPVIKKPESYITKVTFVDENMIRVSPQYEFRYVVEGVSANIGTVKANQENNKVKVLASILGPADSSMLKDATVLCEIYEGENVVAKSEVKTDLVGVFSDTELLLENINVDRSKTVELKVKVIYDGKVVASKEQDLKLFSMTGEALISDIKGTKYEEAVTALNSLGILNGYPDGTFRPENTITRAEFATIATKLGELKIKNNETSKFWDVVEEHWAKPYINSCAENSIVSGYPDGTFKPGNNVTYAESITILVNLLGHKVSVNNSDLGWPDNYIGKSIELGLHKYSDYPDYFIPATRGDIAILTYNAFLRR